MNDRSMPLTPADERARRLIRPALANRVAWALALVIPATAAWGADAGVLERNWPAIASVGGSFVAGYLVGRLARRALKTAAIVAGIALLMIFVLGRFGVDGSMAEQWVTASSQWVGANVDDASRYAASILPSATAATIGGFLGFGSKRNRAG